jgi:hypothetical protein
VLETAFRLARRRLIPFLLLVAKIRSQLLAAT